MKVEQWKKIPSIWCGQLKPQDNALVLRVYSLRVFCFWKVLKDFNENPNLNFKIGRSRVKIDQLQGSMNAY